MSVTTAPAGNVPQLFLPGQAAAPEGPVQAMPMYLMHHAFRRDLAAFAAAVPATPVEDRATWRRLQQRWEWFATVLHKHHSGEDAGLWPMLLDRVDAAGGATRTTGRLRELVQDVLLCRDSEELSSLLEQVADATTDLATSGALDGAASTQLWEAAVASGPWEPRLGRPTAPSLVAT
jgi:hypothetical protein